MLLPVNMWIILKGDTWWWVSCPTATRDSKPEPQPECHDEKLGEHWTGPRPPLRPPPAEADLCLTAKTNNAVGKSSSVDPHPLLGRGRCPPPHTGFHWRPAERQENPSWKGWTQPRGRSPHTSLCSWDCGSSPPACWYPAKVASGQRSTGNAAIKQ